MFLKSLKLDPQSPNTLMSLAVAYHLGRDYVNEKPLLQKYLKLNPSDPQGLRLAVQVLGMLKDHRFGQEALDLMRIHNPNAVELAENFLPRVRRSKTIIITWVRYPAPIGYLWNSRN